MFARRIQYISLTLWKHHVSLLLQSFRSVGSVLHQYIISTDEDPRLRNTDRKFCKNKRTWEFL